jgi:hypothetical protein
MDIIVYPMMICQIKFMNFGDNKMITWDELLNSGELEGYEQGFGTQIDFNIATETPCSECGGQNQFFAMNNIRGSYRAFAVCLKCNNAEEF